MSGGAGPGGSDAEVCGKGDNARSRSVVGRLLMDPGWSSYLNQGGGDVLVKNRVRVCF